MGLLGRSIVFGAGYVVGARAGRERYDQIAAGVRKASQQPRLAPYLEPVANLMDGGSGTPSTSAASSGSGSAADLSLPPDPVLETVPAAAEVPASGDPSGGDASGGPSVSGSSADGPDSGARLTGRQRRRRSSS